MYRGGYAQNASASALFDLDATGTNAFMRFKDAYAADVFRVTADGNVYARGDIQASSLKAGTAIVDTVHIKDAAISIMSTATAGAGTPPAGVWTQVCDVTHTFTGAKALVICSVDVVSVGMYSKNDGENYMNVPYECRYRITVDGIVAGNGLSRVIQPSAGNHNVAVQMMMVGSAATVAADPQIGDKSITVLEMRR